MEIVSYWTFFNEAASKQWPKFLWNVEQSDYSAEEHMQ